MIQISTNRGDNLEPRKNCSRLKICVEVKITYLHYPRNRKVGLASLC